MDLSICAGDNCCDELNTCTDGAADVQACIDCFDDGGGPLRGPAGTCIDQLCAGGGGCGSCGSGGSGGES